jgi:6,7-dimethyl-8-ribityllumazine synthase
LQVKTGSQRADDKSFAIVAARFNDVVTGKLLEGALEALHRMGAADDKVMVTWVPGAFEIPLAALTLARTGRYAAVICLGAVVQGETPHFAYIAGECAAGIAAVGRETGVPAVLGVLTTNTLEQALDRAGGKHGNKGSEAAEVAVEMASLLEQLVT